MDTLAVTSVTNLVLAAETLFLAGVLAGAPKARFSAAWFWAGAMLGLGISALLGGIDHGYIEPAGLDRFPIQRSNWMVMGLATFCVLMATARQFLGPRGQRIALVVGVVQLVVYALAVVLVGDFKVVIANYLPVILLLLALSIRGVRDGTGSWSMVSGLVIMIAASLVQFLGIDAIPPVDHDGLYHLIAMCGVLLLFLGGRRLSTT
jgi:Family of unknown function (DUF6962)